MMSASVAVATKTKTTRLKAGVVALSRMTSLSRNSTGKVVGCLLPPSTDGQPACGSAQQQH